MKNKFCFFNIIILVLVFSFIGTACRKVNRNIISTNSVNNGSIVVSSEISEVSMSKASISESIEILETFKSDTIVLESAEHAERQIVAEILMDLFENPIGDLCKDNKLDIFDLRVMKRLLIEQINCKGY